MIPTPRRRTAVACLLTAVFVLTLALPALATAPSSEAPTLGIERVLGWLLNWGPTDLDRIDSRDESAPYIPSGADSPPIVQLDSGDSTSYTPPDDDGEAAPLIDPDG